MATQTVQNIPGRQLAQLRPSGTTAVSIYAPDAAYRVEIRKINVSNTSALDGTFRIFHDNDGSTYDETTSLFWDTLIDKGETVSIEQQFWAFGQDNGNFAVRSSIANGITFTVYGAEDKVQ